MAVARRYYISHWQDEPEKWGAQNFICNGEGEVNPVVSDKMNPSHTAIYQNSDHLIPQLKKAIKAAINVLIEYAEGPGIAQIEETDEDVTGLV